MIYNTTITYYGIDLDIEVEYDAGSSATFYDAGVQPVFNLIRASISGFDVVIDNLDLEEIEFQFLLFVRK